MLWKQVNISKTCVIHGDVLAYNIPFSATAVKILTALLVLAPVTVLSNLRTTGFGLLNLVDGTAGTTDAMKMTLGM